MGHSKGRALVLIEIEEPPSSPEKIIGNAFAVATSNHVASDRGDRASFAVGAHTQAIIVRMLPEKGVGREKLDTVIRGRLPSLDRGHELSLAHE